MRKGREAAGSRLAYLLSHKSVMRFVDAPGARSHYNIEERRGRVILKACKCLGDGAPSWRLARLTERLSGARPGGE